VSAIDANGQTIWIADAHRRTENLFDNRIDAWSLVTKGAISKSGGFTRSGIILVRQLTNITGFLK